MLIQTACAPKVPSDLTEESIIPKPVSVATTGDYFSITENTGIFIQGDSPELVKIGEFLAQRLNPSSCKAIFC